MSDNGNYTLVVGITRNNNPHEVIECGREYRIFYGGLGFHGGVYDIKAGQRVVSEDERRIKLLVAGHPFTTLSTFYESESEVFYAMNIYKSSLFKYLEGSMVKDSPVTMTIRDFQEEAVEVQGKKKTAYVLYFERQKKGAILNKTNAKSLADHFGPETDNWVGKDVVLYAEQGTAFGKTGFWLRVRPDRKRSDVPVAEDDIPWDEFNWQDGIGEGDNGQADLYQEEA